MANQMVMQYSMESHATLDNPTPTAKCTVHYTILFVITGPDSYQCGKDFFYLYTLQPQT